MPNYHRYYIKNSMIFITVVTNNRIPILIDNIELLKMAIKTANYKFKIYACVVLPDHFHMILHPQNIEEYPKIISSIKYTFSRNLDFIKQDKSPSETNRREKGVWQRRYYDHVIRNEKDLERHLDYIHYNPVKHHLTNAAKDWKYSSFLKFVKEGGYDINWCNLGDKNSITTLDIE